MYTKIAITAFAMWQPWVAAADKLSRTPSSQSDTPISNKTSSGEKSSMSDREKAGLRGPVQQCTEEQTIPAFENMPSTTYTTITKYTPDGRTLQSTTSNSVQAGPPEFSTTYTYDSTGRLVKKTVASLGSPASESKYSYDEKGQVISITDPLRISAFEYDDKGRRSRIISPGADSEVLLPGSTAYTFPVPEDEDPFLPIPAGGHAKILFNDHDQPAEWQVSDAKGNLLNRLIRTYDENGRLMEVRYTMENILLSFPAETQRQFLAEPGASEELEKQLIKILGEKRDFTRTTYKYDADGRLIEKHTYMGPSMETIANITYNDHSDKLEEHTTTISPPDPHQREQSGEPSSTATTPSQQSVTHYSYKYDTFGNWTEQAISSPTSPNDVTVTRRTIVYY
jgi:YD repeat-containing protein